MTLQIEHDYFLPVYFIQQEEMTNEELFRFCHDNRHLRIERNEKREIIIRPPYGGTMSIKNAAISCALAEWNHQYKLGQAFSFAGYYLADGSMRGPNVSWITNDKWNRLPPEQQEWFLPFAPDFLLEVAAPSDHFPTTEEKMHQWIQNGARLAWLIVPKQQLSFIFRADGTVDKVEGFDKKLSGEDVLPGFELDLSILL